MPRAALRRIVEARRGDRKQFRHRSECLMDRRSAVWAEGVELFVSTVGRDAPGLRFIRDRHIGASAESPIGSIPRRLRFGNRDIGGGPEGSVRSSLRAGRRFEHLVGVDRSRSRARTKRRAIARV